MNRVKWNKLFKSEDTKFILYSGLKISAVFTIVSILVSYIIWLIMVINNIYLQANGILKEDQFSDIYYDFLFVPLWDNLPYFIGFNIILFFVGIYIAKILLRPFEIISSYCEAAIEKRDIIYNPDLFSDYKILTRFSELFFSYISRIREDGNYSINTVPPQFSKIHKPVIDKVFLFHFSLVISIIAIISSIFMSIMTVDIHHGIVELAMKTIPNSNSSMAYFLKNQRVVFDSIQYGAIVFIIVAYIALTLHLYSKVSGAAFGFFATMRAFMKGNTEARVHLLGYNHIRPYGRGVNKFLDHICRELSEDQK